jgi:hypothetical protein
LGEVLRLLARCQAATALAELLGDLQDEVVSAFDEEDVESSVDVSSDLDQV